MASKMYLFINYRDSIHYRNSCSATIVIVKFLLSLSTIANFDVQAKNSDGGPNVPLPSGYSSDPCWS